MEVIAMLMVFGMGMLVVIALYVRALKLSGQAQGKITGMATAISAAYDYVPLYDGSPVPARPITSVTHNGYMNGFYVHRLETREAAMVNNRYSARVDVDVYEAQGGTLMASFTTRIIR